MSPNFLFRIERDPNPRDPRARPRRARRSSWPRASATSSGARCRMTSSLALAASGRLRDRQVLDAQVDRMLADPRASAFAENFAGQWLETRNLDVVKPDPDAFKEWDAGAARRDEARDGDVLRARAAREPAGERFPDADYTFLNERLAAHYGIAGVTGSELRRVPLADRSPGWRAQPGGGADGIELSDANLARHSRQVRAAEHPRHASRAAARRHPAARGVGRGRRASSAREQLERHRSNPACATCHRNMDPLGFGLENYDAIGRWRDQDGKFPVDATGMLPDGQQFTTPGRCARFSCRNCRSSRVPSPRR